MSTEQVADTAAPVTQPLTTTPPSPQYFGTYKTPEEAVKGFESMVQTLGWQSKDPMFGDKGMFRDATDPRAAGAYEFGQKILSAGIRKSDPLPDVDPGEHLKSLGFDVDLAYKHYAEKGSLPPSEVAKLKGVPTKWAERFIQSETQRVKALEQMYELRVQMNLGGKENAEKAMAWARTNLPKAEAEQLDANIKSAASKGDIAAFDSAYQNIKQRYETSIGANKQTPVSGTPSPGSAVPFRTEQERIRATQELLAKNIKPLDDPDYRARLIASRKQ